MQWDQYEIWVMRGAKWELSSAFRDFEVASNVARGRGTGVRLIYATYEDGRCVHQDILVEVGAVRMPA